MCPSILDIYLPLVSLKTELNNGSIEEWQIQTHNVRTMLRMNWNQNTLEVGDNVKVFGALGRNSR